MVKHGPLLEEDQKHKFTFLAEYQIPPICFVTHNETSGQRRTGALIDEQRKGLPACLRRRNNPSDASYSPNAQISVFAHRVGQPHEFYE
jgi:hypothetical protein